MRIGSSYSSKDTAIPRTALLHHACHFLTDPESSMLEGQKLEREFDKTANKDSKVGALCSPLASHPYDLELSRPQIIKSSNGLCSLLLGSLFFPGASGFLQQPELQ